MIEIPRRLLHSVIANATESATYEVCGWLAGKGVRVREVYPVPNVAEEPRVSFSMDPEAQLSTMREIIVCGLELTGTYHSHPTTPALPSLRDRRLAYYPESSHLIVSLVNPCPEVRCYRISQKGYKEIKLNIC